jgi:hypothetical protein
MCMVAKKVNSPTVFPLHGLEMNHAACTYTGMLPLSWQFGADEPRPMILLSRQ